MGARRCINYVVRWWVAIRSSMPGWLQPKLVLKSQLLLAVRISTAFLRLEFLDYCVFLFQIWFYKKAHSMFGRTAAIGKDTQEVGGEHKPLLAARRKDTQGVWCTHKKRTKEETRTGPPPQNKPTWRPAGIAAVHTVWFAHPIYFPPPILQLASCFFYDALTIFEDHIIKKDGMRDAWCKGKKSGKWPSDKKSTWNPCPRETLCCPG